MQSTSKRVKHPIFSKRTKRKGKKPSKKEQAQMVALSELGHSEYAISKILGRSHNCIKQYVRSPIFTDPKFRKDVEAYKEQEILDLTTLNIEARYRIHELLPEMSPIEAIAAMDKTFQQRRLLEGKSTANVASLTRIINEAHADHMDKLTE